VGEEGRKSHGDCLGQHVNSNVGSSEDQSRKTDHCVDRERADGR
jgi:hypothetical protein